MRDVVEFTAGRQHFAAVWSARRMLWISPKSASSVKLSGNQCVCRPARLLRVDWLHTDVYRTALQVKLLFVIASVASRNSSSRGWCSRSIVVTTDDSVWQNSGGYKLCIFSHFQSCAGYWSQICCGLITLIEDSGCNVWSTGNTLCYSTVGNTTVL